MARRKRASMREGPLADLFRSTRSHEREQRTSRPRPAIRRPRTTLQAEAGTPARAGA